jgi:protein involved in polysaccharide export with SLBB domain/capsular polysaccharide biosynthesis protein
MNASSRKQLTSAPFDAWAVLEFWTRRWRWLAAWTIIMALAGAYAARSVWGKTFTSTASLIHYEPSSVDDTYHPRDISTPSLVVMLQAPGLFDQVGSQLTPAMTARQLAMHLAVNLDRNNDVVTVTAMSGSRDEAVTMVDKFSFAAIAYTQAMQKQEANEASANVTRQLAQVEQEIASTRSSVPPESKATVGALAAGADDTPAAAPSDLPERIRASRQDLDELLGRYTDAHPLVIAQRAQLAALEDEQRKNPKASVTRTAAAQAALSPIIYGRVTPEEVAMGERLRSLETTRALLISRQRALQPFREAPPGYFRVLLSAAANPTQMRRYRLEIVLFAMLGGFVGLCGSAAQILLAEFLDNRIKTRADVRRVTGLPLLATLGDVSKMSPGSRDQWAFRAWTALQSKLSISPNHGMVCGITSANCSDGRTTWINLLSAAASACGFRVLTITAQPSEEMSVELARSENRKHEPKAAVPGSESATSLTTSVLSTPGQIVDKLTSAECPPVVSIPLPGWVWNLERRRQWRAALEAWRVIDHVVIFIELPPAALAETVLLAENIPNLLWLVDSNKSDSQETLIDLETLRDASCNLVGAVLNRERGTPVRGQFSRWLGNSALLLALGLFMAGTARADVAATASATPDEQGQFSTGSSHPREEWQKHMTLGPGDVLNFHLFGYPELTREEVPVGPDGTISYLEAENILASGTTVDELRDRLDTELSRYRRAPQVYVTPVAFRSKRYYVMGSVVQKGVFYLDRPTTVIEAVARARGFETGIQNGDTIEATDFSHSFISRGGHRLPVDLGNLFLHGDLSQNVSLQPGDYIFFPPSASGEIYVLGAVGSPGPVPYDSDSSALSAIISRGGFSPRAWRAHVLVVRGSLDHPVAMKVDIDGALLGNAPNLALQPGDLVYVSDRPWSRAEDLLDQAASAFVESAVVTWTGLNVGPRIFSRPKP